MIDKQRIRTFILGGAVGALVGIVLAPRSGKELRGSIADRAGEARDRGRENYFETQERLRERLAEMGEGEAQRPTSPEEAPLGTGTAEGPSGEPTQKQEPYHPGPGPSPSAHRPHLRGLRDVSRETQEPLAEPPAEPLAEPLVEPPPARSKGQSEDDEPTGDQTGDRMGDRSEELRRKVRETRDRLNKRRMEGPGDGQA